MADSFDRRHASQFSVCFSLAQRDPMWLIFCGVMLTCANNWMSFAFHAYQAELFPTRIRAQAVGFVYSWSRLSAIFTSLMIGFFLRNFGVPAFLVHRSFHGVVIFHRHFRPAHPGLGAGRYFALKRSRCTARFVARSPL